MGCVTGMVSRSYGDYVGSIYKGLLIQSKKKLSPYINLQQNTIYLVYPLLFKQRQLPSYQRISLSNPSLQAALHLHRYRHFRRIGQGQTPSTRPFPYLQ